MKHSYLIITNRIPAAADGGWIHIVPKGSLMNEEAGVNQIIDDTALRSMKSNLDKDKERLGDKWPGLYAGEEHFIYDDTKSSAAFGWFKDFEIRPDGLWAKDDGLTDLGIEAIKNRRFKFTSFVADRKDLQKITGKDYRVLRLDTIGFTNQANGKELLTPVINRQPEFRPARGADINQQPTKIKSMKSIATYLALSADASEEAVLAEVTKLKNRATGAEAKVGPLEIMVTELTTANATMLDEQIAADLDAHGITDEKIRNRVIPLLKPMKNRAERVAFMTEVVVKPVGSTSTQNKLFNRDGKAPAAGAAESGAAIKADKARAAKIMNRAGAIMKDCNVSLATAVSMAQNEEGQEK